LIKESNLPAGKGRAKKLLQDYCHTQHYSSELDTAFAYGNNSRLLFK